MQCNECKWWDPIGRHDLHDKWVQWKDKRGWGKGRCSKNPPVPHGSKGQLNWPEVLENDCCGSFEPRVTTLETVKRHLREENNRSMNLYYQIQALKKEIRDTGEKFGISRKKKPGRILALMLKKYEEKITKENGE